jgi:uncharacterized alpha-E superfamily protein
MLSRTAENLYWLARYVERAENLARILDVALRLETLPAAYTGGGNEWKSAIETAGGSWLFEKSYGDYARLNVIDFLVSSDANPSSIRNCIALARGNARAVRNAITTEMWEVINGAWLQMQQMRIRRGDANELARLIAFVKELSLRFDGAAYRTMLRDDSYWFERLGLFIERADNTARLLDVKYHVLLPREANVGGGLDYFQWTSVLRSVSAQSSFHYHYRESVKPWLVADFLILRPEQPRSLVACYRELIRNLENLAELYGRQGPAQRAARNRLAGLENLDINTLFQSGLHEFLTGFIADNNGLGGAINQQYLGAVDRLMAIAG